LGCLQENRHKYTTCSATHTSHPVPSVQTSMDKLSVALHSSYGFGCAGRGCLSSGSTCTSVAASLCGPSVHLNMQCLDDSCGMHPHAHREPPHLTRPTLGQWNSAPPVVLLASRTLRVISSSCARDAAGPSLAVDFASHRSVTRPT